MLKVFKNLTKRDAAFALICVGLVFLQVWLELTMPDYTQKLTMYISSGQLNMDDILYNGGMMLLCAVCSMAAAIVCGFFAAQIAANFAKTLRAKLFDKITNFGDVEINRFTTPSLITRTTNDVVQMQMLIAMGLQISIKAPILAIWAICKISFTNVQWTMATLLTVIIIAVLISILIILVYPRFKMIQKLTDRLNDTARENISGVRVVRAFNAEDYQEKKFENVNLEVTRNHLFTARLMGLMMPIMTLCMSGLTLAIYWIGAYIINDTPLMEKPAQVGNMTAFTAYAMQVVMAFMMLIIIFIILPRTMVSARRIAEVLDTDPSIRYHDKECGTAEKGTVEFKNVSFTYPDAEYPCIENISFKINQGETFAIIGATGSGKTSIINLIPRFYDASEGEILVDGVNVKDYPEKQLEKKISVAPQKAILFRGDLKANITYGSEKEIADDDADLLRAIDISGSGFISELENGVRSRVAQGGTNFSGGQKQRISIARAVYKNAEIMIFDDTFSALDYRTDMMVRRALRENLTDTTVIIVAQRIGTIMNADRIMVIDDGRIAGMGTHKELLAGCELYKEIALSQLSKEEL